MNLLKLFQKIEDRNPSKLILSGHYDPDSKVRQRNHKKRKEKKIQVNIPEEYGQKNKQQDVSKPNSIAYWIDHTPLPSGLYSWDARMAQYKQINVIHQSSRMKAKDNMILSINAENTFDKIQHTSVAKILNKLSTEGTSIMKSHVWKAHS